MAQTKIVATIGPASDSEEMLRALLREGMDVARVNFSHGSQRSASDLVHRLRRVAASEGKVLAILGDLQGPKLRLGQLPDGDIQLVTGQTLTLCAEAGRADSIPFPHRELYEAILPGARLVIGDGEIEFQVVENLGDCLRCRVTLAGLLGSRKGVNLPGVTLPISSITDKDKRDLALACDLELDYLAMSFVRSAEDIREMRGYMEKYECRIPIIAKVEKSEAIDRLDEIIEEADGVMVARGDLGIDMPTHEVPFWQKHIIRKCNLAGKPVITATQMLQSMVNLPRPTRAEATDVANAILDGTDAVMLSAETAAGKYPVEAVRTMQSIARITEMQFPYENWSERRIRSQNETNDIATAISSICCGIAERVEAKVIVTATMSGYTAQQVARHRSKTPIVAVTPRAKTCRRMALVWGVTGVQVPRFGNTDEMLEETIAAVCKMGFSINDRIVITAGVPFATSGHTNFLKVHEIVEADFEKE